MNCTQLKNMLDDYLDGSLSAVQLMYVQSHLNCCDECQHIFTQAQNLTSALKEIPVPPAKAGYEERMLKFLSKKSPVKPTQQTRRESWFIAGFSSAVAATFALWLVFSPLSIFSTNSENMSIVNLLVQEKKTIDLVFNLGSDLTNATLTLELPEKIEISGFPGKRQLAWETSFKKGTNRLALPLIGSELNSGILTARLSQKGITKTFHVRINTTLPPTPLFIEQTELKATNT